MAIRANRTPCPIRRKTIDHLLLAEQFRAASIGMVAWEDALAALARHSGARAGQMAMLDPDHGLMFNILSNVSAGEIADYFASGGPDPARNPRTRALVDGSPLRCMTEEDFTTPDIVARSPIYRGLFARYDVDHACLVRLNPAGARTSGLTLLRPASAGPANADQRRLIERVAPAVAGAIETGLQLGVAVDRAVVTTTERVTGPALLLGAGMTILSLSPAAEAILRAGTHLSVRGGRLHAPGRAGTAALDRGFAEACAPDAASRANVPIVLQPAGPGAPLRADFAPLPRCTTGPLSLGRALLVLMPPRTAPRSGTLLAATFGLTGAEVAVAHLLADGLDIAAIAAHRGSAVSTVRNQVKSLLEKTGTRRQAELIRQVAAY